MILPDIFFLRKSLLHQEIFSFSEKCWKTRDLLPKLGDLAALPLASGKYFHLLYTKVCYMSFWAIWLVHSYYTMTSYYTDLPFMAHSSCSYCMDLPFMVDSIGSSAACGPTAVLQVNAAQTLPAVMLHMIDSLNFSLKVYINSCRNSAEDFTSTTVLIDLICLRLKLHWFSPDFQEVHQLAHADQVSTGQTVKSRPVVCHWITWFYES